MRHTICGSSCGCQGRKYLTKEEQKERLLHKQECLEKELQGIREALAEINK